MQPTLAFPYNDPDGTMFHHLQAILPHLKNHFERAYICPPLSTLRNNPHISRLRTDNFFTIFPIDRETQVGEHFAHLYRLTAETASPEQIIHLCFLDRLAFALEGDYKNALLADIDSLTVSDVPLIFQRSQTAWDTHPQNYRQLEGIVTTVGKNLFGRELDYSWCHIALQAKQLRELIPLIKNPDMSMVAEMIFYMRDTIKTRDVDWLAWEDPIILNRDAKQLKQEREQSLDETNKRLKYILPMLDTLTRLSKNGKDG